MLHSSWNVNKSLWGRLWNGPQHLQFFPENGVDELCLICAELRFIFFVLCFSSFQDRKTSCFGIRCYHFEFSTENGVDELCFTCAKMCRQFYVLGFIPSQDMEPQHFCGSPATFHFLGKNDVQYPKMSSTNYLKLLPNGAVLFCVLCFSPFVSTELQCLIYILVERAQDKMRTRVWRVHLSRLSHSWAVLVSSRSSRKHVGKSVPSQRKWDCLECLVLLSKVLWLHSHSILEPFTNYL